MLARAVDRYTAVLQKLRFAVVAFWLLAGIVASLFVMPFIHKTTQHFDPPVGTPARIANDDFIAAFPDLANRARFTVYVDADHSALRRGGYGSIVDVPSVRAFCNAFEAALKNTSKVIAVENYYDIAGTVLGQRMVAPGNNSVLAALRYDAAFNSKAATNYVPTFQGVVGRLADAVLYNATLNSPSFDTGALGYGISGIAVVVASAIHNVQKDMGLTDAVVMPCAMVVFMLTIQSGRLMLFPLFGVALTLAISFGMCCFIAEVMGIFTSVPSLMMSLCISMSIDYNLFLLSRYFEEIAVGNRGPAVIAAILKSAGRTILVSGTTLMIPFAALCALPMQIMRSFGVGCSLVIIMAMFISLTFTPALLLAGACFFERCTQPWAHCLPLCLRRRLARCCCSGGHCNVGASAEGGLAAPLRPEAAGTVTEAPDATEGEGQCCVGNCFVVCQCACCDPGPEPVEGEEYHPVKSEISDLEGGHGDPSLQPGTAPSITEAVQQPSSQTSVFRHLAVVTRFPFNLITLCVVVGVGVAFGWKAFTLKNTDAFTAYFTRGTDTAAAYGKMAEDFGFGFMEPYTILLQTHAPPPRNATPFLNGTAISEASWAQATKAVEALIADPDTPVTLASFVGPVAYGGHFVPWETMRLCAVYYLCPDLDLPLLLEQFVTKDRRSLVVQMTSSIAPTGNRGNWLYHRLLDAIDAATAATPDPPCTVGLAGVGPSSMAAVQGVYDKLPLVVGASAASVFIILGVAFRSLVIPIRALLTIAVTEAFVLGLTVLVFQDEPGILDWMGWGSLQSQGAVSWIGPVVGCLVTLGVALDYDVFLVARVAESLSEQEAGTTRAVVEGLCSTGRIITAAGLIMAIAFFGLVLTPVTLLNIVGFILVAAVLFDTFVVRTVLVPAVMSMLGRWNWWPRRPAGDE